jgi:hypothetical protein
MSVWTVNSTEEYLAWFSRLDEDSQRAIFRGVLLLEEFGPMLGRPHVDTLKGSSLTNLKELRSHTADHVYRVAFLFDEKRKALLLVGGDKKGVSDREFYKKIIPEAEALYSRYRGKE